MLAEGLDLDAQVLVCFWRWAGMLQCPFRGQSQVLPSGGLGEEAEQTRWMEMLVTRKTVSDSNFLSVAAAYGLLWQLNYQYSTHKGIADQQELVLIQLRLSALTDGMN